MTEGRYRFGLALVAVFAVAVALRGGPLLQSPLPFNPDGIVHATHAGTTRTTGHLPLETLAPDDLLFTAFLAAIADVLGVSAMESAQPVIAVVGAIPCLVAAVVARRIALRTGRDRRRAALAGTLAAGLLAVQGVFLHRSMPVDEQTLGLSFVPLAVVTAAIAVRTGSRRWSVLAAVLLIALPATHNLDAVVATLALTGLAALAVSTGRQRVAGRASLVAGAAWVALVVYTLGIARLTPAAVIQSERITGVPGLFLAWTVLVVFTLPWFVRVRARTQRGLAVGTFAALFGLVFVNSVFPIFPQGPETPPLLVVGLVPLLALAVVASWAIPTARVGPEGRAMAALAGAVLILVGLSLTAALTPAYENLAYRVQTFLHLPVMVAAGLGVVELLARGTRASSRRVTATVIALALVAAAATVPVAYGGLAVLPYKGITTPAEYGTAQFTAEHVEGGWAADNHVARITWGREDRVDGSNGEATSVPVYEWVEADAPPPDCPTVVQRSWSTVGAQFFPHPPAALDGDTRRGFRQRGHVIYATAGTSDPLRLVVPRSDDHRGC